MKSNPDAIKVAPIHYPKLPVELSELYEGKIKKTASAKLTYRGGKILANAEVFLIFLGSGWETKASLVTHIHNFFTYILQSPFITQLSEYSTALFKIGNGKVTGSKIITIGAPKTSISDSSIQTLIKGWIANGTIPKPNKNTLYFIYFDEHIIVSMGGGKSCSSFCGYHNDISGNIFYAAMPYPSCAGCLGGMNVRDALTGTSSHELAEAITDPIPGTGWYDDTNGEIGDLCGWRFKKMNGYNIQLEWSNKANKCL